jgi:hypothetical protein
MAGRANKLNLRRLEFIFFEKKGEKPNSKKKVLLTLKPAKNNEVLEGAAGCAV